jgi:hypothetical protein
VSRPKRSAPVRGLRFKITVTPLRNGHPWPGVDPIDTFWDDQVPQWHEDDGNDGIVLVLMRELERRVRLAIQPRNRR